MVRDRANRFPGNASWGNGWVWAPFRPGKVGNVLAERTVDCLGCHVPERETESIYKEAYPTLEQWLAAGRAAQLFFWFASRSGRAPSLGSRQPRSADQSRLQESAGDDRARRARV